MNLYVNRLQQRLKALLKRFGLLEATRWFWRLIMLLAKPEYRHQMSALRRRECAKQQRFLHFKEQYGEVLRYSLLNLEHPQKRVLIVGVTFPQVEIELGLIKALEIAGFDPVVLIVNKKKNLEYYKLAAIKEILFLSEFTGQPELAAAEAATEKCHSIQELLAFEFAGVRVGRTAVATALREQHMASLDLNSPNDRRMIVKYVASSMAYAAAAQRVLLQSCPDLVLVWDGVYTPDGEIFDSCLANGIDVIIWESAHRSTTLMLKRYTFDTRNEHPVSLSSASWRWLCDIKWTNSRRQQLQRELYGTYAGGDWYSSAGTQFDTRFVDVDVIKRQLGLDLRKKTAFIFPHIFWDASFTWGSDLFHNYEEWLVETVQAACANPQINWVIKIHPAHVFKSMIDGYRGEPAEVSVLRKRIGKLPCQIYMIPADSEISTYSLFELMDYCLTVRGTIGIEAARLGIPVLTAGTGRYDRRGFTIDSESREEYIDKLNRIQEIPRLSPTQQELGERFAYGLFVLRPFPLTTVSFEYHKDYGAEIGFNKTQINITKPEEWRDAPDLKAFAHWVTDSNNADFLMPLPEE